MESQPQNPEFRNNPENFHTCDFSHNDITFTKKIHTKELVREIISP